METDRKGIQISREEARRLILSAHRELLDRVPGTDDGVSRMVSRLGYLQIDTIHLFMRAHHQTLWNRMEDYRPSLLTDAQISDRSLFEYWSHAASIIPMKDYRYCLPRMHRIREDGRFWFEKIPDVSEMVFEIIRNEGPKKARDFKDDGHRGNWWDWKPAKKALQYLQMAGLIAVSHREGFAKVYDLTERIIPDGVDRSFPTAEESAVHLIKSRLKAEGLLSTGGIKYLRRDGIGAVGRTLEAMEEDGRVVRYEVEDAGIYYGLKEQADPGGPFGGGEKTIRLTPQVRILSPFDNLVIIRDRLNKIFEYELSLECYLPAAKRRFGYFAQPILYGNEFVGKIDFKIEGPRALVRNLELKRRAGLTDAFRREWQRILAARGAEETVVGKKTGDKEKLFIP